MKLKAIMDSLDGLDENLAKLYTKREDGKFILEVDGLVDKSKLDEFRTTNVKLMKDLEKFKDVDPVKYTELMTEHRKIQEKEWIEAGEIDKVVEQRVTQMRTDFETREAGYKTNAQVMTAQLEKLLIDNNVREAATKMGVRPTAVDDVLLRARTMYKVKDGNAVPFNAKGEIVYGKDGTSPMAISDWVESLKGTADHLFTPSSGGGSQGGAIPGNGTANLTATQKIAQGLRKSA